jgi:hypothetical protein
MGPEIKQATSFPAGTLSSSCFYPITCVIEEMSPNNQRSKKDSLNVALISCSEKFFFFKVFYPLSVIFNIANISPAPPPKLNFTERPDFPCHDSDTVICCLMTGIRTEKGIVRQFHCHADVIECTYTNLDSIASYTLRLYVIAYCC